MSKEEILEYNIRCAEFLGVEINKTLNYEYTNGIYGFKAGAKWQKEQILQFLYDEITERRDYSASKMCEKVIEFINNTK